MSCLSDQQNFPLKFQYIAIFNHLAPLEYHVCVTFLGFFYKRRQLILTDAPRLYYVDPVVMELKGEIPW